MNNLDSEKKLITRKACGELTVATKGMTVMCGGNGCALLLEWCWAVSLHTPMLADTLYF